MEQLRFESHEQPPITKEQVVAAYQKIINKGVTSSFEMDSTDPDVVAVNDLSKRWMMEGDEAVKNDPLAHAKFNFEKTFLTLDAGFIDKKDAEEILFDHAQQDIEDIQDQYPELAQEIKEKIEFYMKKLDISPEHADE